MLRSIIVAAVLFAAGVSDARADVFYFDRATGKVTQLPDSAAPGVKNAHAKSACTCEVCECKNCECLDALDSADDDGKPSLVDPADASPRSRNDVKAEAKRRVRFDVCNGKSCTTFEVNEGDPIPAGARNVRFAPASSAAPRDASPLEDFDASPAAASDEARGERRRGLFARIRDNIQARRAARQEARANRGGIFGRARGGSCASCGQ